MFLEALLPRADLHALLTQAFPLILHLDDAEPDHTLALHDLTEVELVPDLGLRIVCKGKVHWPVLGIDAPLTLHSLRVVLIPEVKQTATGDVLMFKLALEHVDVAGVPDMIDDKISEAVNAKLGEKNVELSWDFSKTLAQIIALPALLEPLDALTMRAAWGKVKITEEALVFALSLHVAIVRDGDPRPIDSAAAQPTPAPVAPSPPRVSRALARRTRPSAHIATAAAFGFAAGAAFFTLRAIKGRT